MPEDKPKRCRVCGCELTEYNRSSLDNELCESCESDEAHEEGLEW